jgi:hypothetical protein
VREALDSRSEFGGVDRLRHVQLKAGRQGALPIFGPIMGCQRSCRSITAPLWSERSEPAKQGIAVCSRHFYVAKKDIRMELFDRVYRFTGTCDNRGDRSAVGQQFLQEPSRLGIVVDRDDGNTF